MKINWVKDSNVFLNYKIKNYYLYFHRSNQILLPKKCEGRAVNKKESRHTCIYFIIYTGYETIRNIKNKITYICMSKDKILEVEQWF